MNGPDGLFRWALGWMQRLQATDGDAPAFAASYAESQSLPADLIGRVRARSELPGDADQLTGELERLFVRHAGNARSPRFQNQLFSGVLPEALGGHLLGAFSNLTISTREVAPLATEIERAVTGWLVEMLGWQGAMADGSATPAGSFSNYLAVYLARKRAQARVGAAGLHRLAVFTSESSHYSVPKGADLAGIPVENVFHVATDERDRMCPQALARAIADARDRDLVPYLVVATLGTTVSGALDPLAAIAEVTAGEDVWLHVDAAWGGLGFLASDAARRRAGLDRADSVTWDAHKAALSPVALSFLLVRDGRCLQTLRPPHGGRYLFQHPEEPPGEGDLGLTSLYCGKPFLALGLWLLWKARGDAGLRAHADRAWTMALRFRDAVVADPHLELVLEPETAAVIFRPALPPGTDERTAAARTLALRERLVASGEWLIRACPVGERTVLRSLFVNPYFDETCLERWIAHVKTCAAAEA